MVSSHWLHPPSFSDTYGHRGLDFCFWAPPSPGRSVGEIEGEMVAWCTQPGHGTRVMVDGTLTGVQFTKAPDYVQVWGFISDQSRINMVPGDAGGEMDPHGADQVRETRSTLFVPPLC